MASIRQSVEVRVPLATAYNQWTQFEDFPRFMEGVREVRQLDDAHLHWRADRRGRSVEWDSEITEQVPDQRIVWRDIGGPGNHGSVRFQSLQQDLTRVDLELELAPQLPGIDQGQHEAELRRRIEQDMLRFKQLLEEQGDASGAWRGEIGRDSHGTPPPH
jgi:uncharacterized membrane protein